ncbi:hypothetical protein BBP40_010009 [Aspergillus hancockii]|nr:hypothetical protein BBP40_010009 [Aspergillus hancockii]
MGLVRDETWVPEIWTLFGVGTIILFSRVGLRCWVCGFREPAAEDCVSLLIPAFYTVCAVGSYLVYTNGNKVDFTQAEINVLTDEQARRVILGTKWELALAFSYPTVLWLLKASLLLLYWRLTRNLGRHRLLVGLTAIICILTYVGIILSISLACIPLRKFWQIKPLPSTNCTHPPNLLIAMVVSNVFTDSGIIALPIILLAKLHISQKKKLKVLCFLSSGTIVTIVAIVRVSITLPKQSQLSWNRWGMRELFVDIIAVYIPAFRATLRSGRHERDSSPPSESTVAITWPSTLYPRQQSLDSEMASPISIDSATSRSLSCPV